jgi:hypothetical protein
MSTRRYRRPARDYHESSSKKMGNLGFKLLSWNKVEGFDAEHAYSVYGKLVTNII